MDKEAGLNVMELGDRQIAAIKHSIELGMKLQKDFPGIKSDYCAGVTTGGIAEKYTITSKYGVSETMARNSISIALRGHKGYFRILPFDGLIQDPIELERLCLEHDIQNGQLCYELGIGIHGRTTEQRREHGQKVGKMVYDGGLGIHGRLSEQRIKDSRKGGYSAFQQGVGIHSKTSEEKSQYGLKGGTNSALSRGLTPWKGRVITDTYCTISEIEFAYNLSQLPEYERKTQTNNALIAQKVNELYYNSKQIRNAQAIKQALRRFKNKT